MSGFTLLHSCVAGTDSPQRAQIIEMLHEAGAKLDVYDDEKGLTPLHYAALRDKPLCAAALIRCGASVHATEGNGATALHGAAYFGHVAVTRVLLEGGADPSRADGRGNTPLALARAEGHTEVLNLLEEAAEKKRR